MTPTVASVEVEILEADPEAKEVAWVLSEFGDTVDCGKFVVGVGVGMDDGDGAIVNAAGTVGCGICVVGGLSFDKMLERRFEEATEDGRSGEDDDSNGWRCGRAGTPTL